MQAEMLDAVIIVYALAATAAAASADSLSTVVLSTGALTPVTVFKDFPSCKTHNVL